MPIETHPSNTFLLDRYAQNLSLSKCTGRLGKGSRKNVKEENKVWMIERG